MLDLSEVKVFLLSSHSVKNFKYWAEVIIDLLLIGLFMLVILSWQSIFYTESAGLACVFTNQDNLDLQISEGRYIASMCLLESGAKYLLFYPYFEFLQFLLLIISQVMWHHVPKVKSKLELYHDIFDKIYEIDPEFDQEGTTIVPILKLGANNRELATLIRDKLIFLITDNSCIAQYYIFKNALNAVLTIVFISINMFWIHQIIANGVDFACELENGEGKKYHPPISCNISPFYYFLGYLCLFQAVLFLVLLFTIINLILFADIKKFQSKVHDLLGSGGDRLCGLPGFFDFALYVTMHHRNVKDGGFHLQMIKFVINLQGPEVVPTLESIESTNYNETRVIDESTDKFSEELGIISDIAEKLHMSISLQPYTHDHIYHCVAELIAKDVEISFDVYEDIKQSIHDEISANTLYYGYLFTGLMSDDGASVKQMLRKLEDYLFKLSHKNAWPNNLILAAASNLLQLKIVLIKTGSKCQEYIDQIEIFEPYSRSWNGRVAIFSLIYPYYYNLLHPIQVDSTEILEQRINFINFRNFRHQFIDDSRKKALRCMLTLENKGHVIARSLTQIEKNEAAQKVYEDQFYKTVLPTSKLVAARFRVINYNAQKDKVHISKD